VKCLCSLLLLAPSASHAEDYYIDFIGSTVLISPNDGSEAVVVEVGHLIEGDEPDTNVVSGFVFSEMKRKLKEREMLDENYKSK